MPHQLFNRTTINRVARTMDPYTDDWALELGGDRAGRLAAPVPPPAPMGAVGLTDEVALNMYEYWREGGMASVLASKLYGALATCLTTLWTVALFVGVDWQALVSPAAVLRLRVSDMVEHPTAADVLFMVYFACGMAASAYLMVDAATAVKRLRRTRGYLRANMGVATDADLAMLTWDALVSELQPALMRTGWRATILVPRLPAEFHRSVAARITRVQDMVTLLHTTGVLGDLLGWIPASSLTTSVVSLVCVHPLLSGSHAAPVPVFERQEPRMFRHRAAVVGAATTLLLPFIVLWVVVRAVAGFAEEIHARGGTMARRSVPEGTKQAMREYTELPHELDLRMRAAPGAVTDYLDQVPTPVSSKLAAAASYTCVLPLMLLVVVGFVQEGALTGNLLWGRNLLWWAATLGSAVALARGLRSSGGAGAAQRGEPPDPKRYMDRFKAVVRRAGGPDPSPTALVPLRIVTRARSLVAALAVPILCVRIFRRADRVAHVLNTNIVDVPGTGPVARSVMCANPRDAAAPVARGVGVMTARPALDASMRVGFEFGI